MTNCICGTSSGRPFAVSEHHFGLGDQFTYLECETCGSLRIQTIPPDLVRFYPRNYYSFCDSDRGWRDGLQPAAMRFALQFAVPALPWVYFPWASIVQKMDISRADRVLDVGSGVNGMTVNLRAAGHQKALGIDPFVPYEVQDGYGLAVRKAHLSEMDGPWDIIAFNHSLEHVMDPSQELRIAKSLLSPNGRIIVRTPVAAWACREYGSCWYQLDAPRHLLIPTERGFRLLATRIGMRVTKVIYDSNYMQFWHSENYRKGISLVSGSPHYWGVRMRSQRFRMTRRAARLNRSNEGDQAAFFLTVGS